MKKYDKNEIFNELKELSKLAYSPYSNFNVSCIFYMKDGFKLKGVNIENAAYNPTICAERAALPQMFTNGYSKDDVDVIALYTSSNDMGSPCGTCRQTLCEVLNQKQIIFIFSKKGFCAEFTLNDLLPYSFKKTNLD